MFCSDDKHPQRSAGKGSHRLHLPGSCRHGCRPHHDRAGGLSPRRRYFLLNNRGAIAPGYLADFAIVEDLNDFHVVTVYKRGKRVYHDGIVEDFPLPEIPEHLNKRAHDTFHLPVLSPADFANTRLRGVIGMVPGQIITEDAGYAAGVDVPRTL